MGKVMDCFVWVIQMAQWIGLTMLGLMFFELSKDGLCQTDAVIMAVSSLLVILCTVIECRCTEGDCECDSWF